MAVSFSLREKAIAAQSLVCLLQSLRGLRTKVELRNEDSVTGTIVNVDAYMNLSMSSVSFHKIKTQEIFQFEQFFVVGKNVRYVHIPDEVDIIQSMEHELGLAKRHRETYARKPKQRFVPEKEKREKAKQTAEARFQAMKAKLDAAAGKT